MATYQSTLRFLYGLQGKGMKFGLRNTKSLLTFLGNPERLFPSIHIAGTNGKGSTAAFLASIFTESGYKAGLYTSPHLVRFTERIRIDGVEMSEEMLVSYAAALKKEIERVNATFFEATTCIAFKYFADSKVDVAIIETGLGGRLDSTNVLMPLASVITPIAFDHMEYLGNTIRKIAREKAGIIKPKVPVITSASSPEALAVLRSVARKKQCSFVRSTERIKAVKFRNGRTSFIGKNLCVKKTVVGLPGDHQVGNACAACATLDLLMGRTDFARKFYRVGNRTVKAGLERVLDNTRLRGRFEEIQVAGGMIFLDVAHNPDGLRILASALQTKRIVKPIVIFGVMADKDVEGIIRIIGGLTDVGVAVSPKNSRAAKSSELARLMRNSGMVAYDGKSVSLGLKRGLEIAGVNRAVVVTGSHYVVGEAMRSLDEMLEK